MRQPIHNIFSNRYQVPGYLWWIKSILKSWNVRQNYVHDYPKLSFSFHSFDYDKVSENSNIWKCLKESSIGKTPPTQVKNLLMTFSWPKPNIKNKVYRKLFNLELWHNTLTLYLYERFEKAFADMKDIKIFKLTEEWGELKEKMIYTDNCRQNLRNNVKKSNKIGYGWNHWYLILRNFWPLIPRFYFCEENWALDSDSSHFLRFLNISLF